MKKIVITNTPEVLLLVSTHCSHCHQVLSSLTSMVKKGEISRLDIINVERQPEAAKKLGIRSLPWIKIGRIELMGARSEQELKQWALKANSTEGMLLQLNEWLTTDQLATAEEAVVQNPDYLDAIMQILAEPEAKINVRVGIGVILESIQGTDSLKKYLPHLVKLASHESASVRADIAYYLGLTCDKRARTTLELLINDENKDVREIATDALEDIVLFFSSRVKT